MKNYRNYLEKLLEITIKNKASDLHLSPGRKPILRIDGKLHSIKGESVLSPEEVVNIVREMIDKNQFDRLLKELDIDFSYSLGKLGRFRGNVFFQQGMISCVLRFIPARIPTLDELNLPPILHKLAKSHQGFILVTGPASHGKSTTLASLIDEINHTRAEHIITIEDPIEYVFEDDLSIIDQREVYTDTLSFARALRATFREDPDVIMVGEMRDPETIATALTAAETGHLVLATLHTNSAAQTIHRIVDSFTGVQQAQVRAQLSSALLAVISQRLIPRIGGGLIPACEILLNTPAVSNLIRENKIHEIPLVISTSAEEGMMTLNQSLAVLTKEKKITLEDAYNYSINPKELGDLLKKYF